MAPELTTKLVGELIGSFTLIAMGCGVSMNHTLDKSYGEGNKATLSGPLGWGFAVAMAAIISMPFNSGGHFNPAVTIGVAAAGLFQWSYVLPYIGAQAIGSFIGAILVWFVYKNQFEATEDPYKKRDVFGTNASIRNPFHNFVNETVATFFLVLIITSMNLLAPSVSLNGTQGAVGLGAVGALPAGFMIFAIGMAFGGVTGWSLNPTRDLMPRLAYTILPIKGKIGSDWGYGIVVASIGPIVGCLLAAGVFLIIKEYSTPEVLQIWKNIQVQLGN